MTADILPECLIHKIVCYLSYREAARMSILSKTWLQAWLNHPNLKLGVGSSGEGVTTVDTIMERYRDANIPIDRFKFSNLCKSDDSGEFFPRIDKWLRIAVQNGVKDLLYNGKEAVYSDTTYSLYPFPIFRILAEAKCLREVVLKHCNLMPVLLSTSHVANCESLRKLSLTGVHLDDIMLQTLLSSCPLIVDLTIDSCTGLKKNELLNLQKIRSLNITRNNYPQFFRIHAPTLEYLYYSCHYSLKELDIVECQNLKSLKILCTDVHDPDGVLKHLISRSQSLESLELVSLFLGRFSVCKSRSLKVLKLKDCEIIGEINFPNLVLLEYNGFRNIPRLKFAKEASQLKHSSHIILERWCNPDAMWLRNLRELLSNSISWSQVTLHISKCNEINRKDLLLYHGDATPQVDVLDVYLKSSKECPTFVDALLWSCHPRRLNLSSTSNKMMACFINCLICMKKSSRPTSHGGKPWLNQLKEVKAYDWNSQPVKLRSGELAMRTLTERQNVYFLLDW